MKSGPEWFGNGAGRYFSVKNNENKFLGSKSDLGIIDPLGLKINFRPQKLVFFIFDADSEKHIYGPFGDSFEILMVLKTFLENMIEALFFVKPFSSNNSVTGKIY